MIRKTHRMDGILYIHVTWSNSLCVSLMAQCSAHSETTVDKENKKANNFLLTAVLVKH